MTLLKIALPCLLLAACSFGGPPHPQTTYVLSDPQPVAPATTPRWPGVLLVEEMDTPVFYRSPALAFSREAGTRGHYQYARYSDPPGPALTTLISRRLVHSSLFQGVSAPGQGVQGHWQLNLRLIDFYLDADAGQVRLAFEAELVERGSGRLLTRKTLESQASVSVQDAAGAARAGNQAVGGTLDQLTQWLGEAR